MKLLALALVTFVVSSLAHADPTPPPTPSPTPVPFTNITHKSAVIENIPVESGQAAEMVNADELQDFIDLMQKDPQSLIARLIAQDGQDNGLNDPDCNNSYCGEIVLSDSVQVDFGRGGWADAGQTRRLYVQFLSAGSGHYLQSDYEIDISESVDAQDPMSDDQPAKFNKTYEIVGGRKITGDDLNLQ